MGNFIGRESERATLQRSLDSSEAELVAIYGRRRVGKTFLVREFFGDRISFELTGVHDVPVRAQLENFAAAMGRAVESRAGSAKSGRAARGSFWIAGGPRWMPPTSWASAFDQLRAFLESLPRTRKHVVFLDELPWLASRRSGFLPAFEHFWNHWASTQPHLVVVICGSAAAWMIHRVIHHRGGLHNRVTRRIRLEPFSLAETLAYLRSRGVDLGMHQTLELYMVMGGIPHYLKELEPGRSAAQAIDAICFSKDGLLRDEFGRLYASLFEHSERHVRAIRAMARRRRGLRRDEILKAGGMRTGGGASDLLEELVESGFVLRTAPFGKSRKDALYRLSDEYSLFYLAWIENCRATGKDIWLKRRASPAWKAWSGYAFESVCLKHVRGIKRALGIEAVDTTEASWAYRSEDPSESGAQIDLVIDRRDGCVNLCEMKFTEDAFVIDKRYAARLRQKRDAFRRATGTRKTLFLTMVTSCGIRPNEQSTQLAASSVVADALFS